MINIVPTEKEHGSYILETLRPEDRKEIESAGNTPERAIFLTLKCAIYSKTALVYDKPAAIWGIAGNVLSDTGVPFLLTGTEVYKVSPMAFSRIYLRELSEMKQYFPRLENYVDSTYTGAVKMLKIAGFSLDEPFKAGDGSYQKFYIERSV